MINKDILKNSLNKVKSFLSIRNARNVVPQYKIAHRKWLRSTFTKAVQAMLSD